jgi:hypothetical protein
MTNPLLAILDLDAVPIDGSLMRDYFDRGGVPRPPIAGPGSEARGFLGSPSWCGYCGYTGRCLGPVQASCPERHGWHRWLARCIDLEMPMVPWEARVAA